MSGTLISDVLFRTITCRPLHPTFGAEVVGAHFNNMSEEQLQEIKSAMAKYNVLVFRKANLTDEEHIEFSRRFGELDYLFDVSNIGEDGKIVDPESPRAYFSKGNYVFHSDGTFNRQRASWSILRAVQLPPPGTGGQTEYADSLAAWDDLDEDLKHELLERDLIGCHSLLQLRKLGAPEYFKDVNPWSSPFMRFRIVSTHEPSGRKTLYVGNYLHHLETRDGTPLPEEENERLMKKLIGQVTHPKNVLSVDWHENGDMIAWDNISTLHRATRGSFEGKHFRDMRRTTVKDNSKDAWGLNPRDEMEGQNLSVTRKILFLTRYKRLKAEHRIRQKVMITAGQ
ncbi:hypothetical protein COCMIDRAFT_38512 [Bipolaris oryzae ATCC 44560]|uniref:TauD/TfdA-like domain-containing protein n=1 Tax=Bipolaris oryzae ATCC 44560 TaxID=930090 RepID=W6Z0U1_COCMI|nr:uncharacterized protein COCMIDRAFT_38512 [Bipolaris oryzae ATCC 44560]EUC43575.1 hypothetical protein COCMIDRAFT_38512 [Bipolaris oryzae ATCC 44560]